MPMKADHTALRLINPTSQQVKHVRACHEQKQPMNILGENVISSRFEISTTIEGTMYILIHGVVVND